MTTQAEIEAEIASLKTQRTQVLSAITAITTGAQSYTLDTGQSRQTVNRANLSELRNLYDWLSQQIDRLCAKLNGGAVTHVRPGF